MRETEKAYCISPRDMRGPVIAGLVLSLINLMLQTDENQRIEIAGKNHPAYDTLEGKKVH